MMMMMMMMMMYGCLVVWINCWMVVQAFRCGVVLSRAVIGSYCYRCECSYAKSCYYMQASAVIYCLSPSLRRFLVHCDS